MMKKFSIVVATYNSGNTLKRCLDSIVPQLGSDGELLVIDGASKDNTMDIVHSYGDKIYYSISEPDKGVYDAWNKAVKEVRGQWIVFIGSDDFMLPNTFDIYRNFLNINGDDYDLICARLLYINKNGEVLREIGEPWDWQKLIYRKWKFAHPGMLHNKRCFDKIGLFDIGFRICSDLDFLVRLGPNVKTGFINDVLVKMSEGGISDSIDAIKEAFLITKRNNVLPFIPNFLSYVNVLIRFIVSKLVKR